MNELRSESPAPSLQCSEYDVKSENFMVMKSHVRMYHTDSKSAQTDTTELDDKAVQYKATEGLNAVAVQTEDFPEDDVTSTT